MIRLFKQSTLGQILVILLTAMLLWVKAFITPVDTAVCNYFSPIYGFVFGWLSHLPRLATALALLLTLVEGAWFNLILTNHKMTKANSLMPMLLYVVAMSWNYELLTMTPMLLVNALVLASCSQLLSDGTTSLTVGHNFNASFCIGLMALCYLPSLCYFVPFSSIILFTYAFMCDKLDYYLILIQYDLLNFNFHFESISFWRLLPTLVFLLILVAALFRQLGSIGDNIVHQRINTGIVILPLIASILLTSYTKFQPLDTQSYVIPFSFLVTRFLMAERKRHWVNETLIWLVLICALVNVLFN